MLEKEIEKVLVNEVKRLGGRAYKFESPGNRGVPDRMVCLPKGRIYFVELKTEKGRTTDLQDIQIDRLRILGQKVCVAYGIAGVAKFFASIGEYDTATKLHKKYGIEIDQEYEEWMAYTE